MFRNRKIWEKFLKKQSITTVNSVRIVTESALLGSIISHGFPAERDIREYVKRRKISGSTRSEAGRRVRDTFASLKKYFFTQDKSRIKFLQPFVFLSLLWSSIILFGFLALTD